MARRPAQPKPTAAATPENTEGTDDARTPAAGPAAAEAPQAPPVEQGGDAAGGANMPPAEVAAVVVVTGPERGRRRIGRRFDRDPVLIPVDALTPEDIAALTNDPQLTVVLRPAAEP